MGTTRTPVLSGVEAFDTRVDALFEWLRGRPAADHLLYAASAVGDHSLIWVVLAAIRATRSRRDLLAAARLAATLPVESALVNGAVKSAFRRRRPEVTGGRPLYLRQPRTSSFPSGHASSAACALVLLADEDPAWALYLAIAALVTASRIHVRIHHASDVVAGLAVGAALGLAVRRLVPLDRLDPPEGAGGRAGGRHVPADSPES